MRERLEAAFMVRHGKPLACFIPFPVHDCSSEKLCFVHIFSVAISQPQADFRPTVLGYVSWCENERVGGEKSRNTLREGCS